MLAWPAAGRLGVSTASVFLYLFNNVKTIAARLARRTVLYVYMYACICERAHAYIFKLVSSYIHISKNLSSLHQSSSTRTCIRTHTHTDAAGKSPSAQQQQQQQRSFRKESDADLQQRRSPATGTPQQQQGMPAGPFRGEGDAGTGQKARDSAWEKAAMGHFSGVAQEAGERPGRRSASDDVGVGSTWPRSVDDLPLDKDEFVVDPSISKFSRMEPLTTEFEWPSSDDVVTGRRPAPTDFDSREVSAEDDWDLGGESSRASSGGGRLGSIRTERDYTQVCACCYSCVFFNERPSLTYALRSCYTLCCCCAQDEYVDMYNDRVDEEAPLQAIRGDAGQAAREGGNARARPRRGSPSRGASAHGATEPDLSFEGEMASEMVSVGL